MKVPQWKSEVDMWILIMLMAFAVMVLCSGCAVGGRDWMVGWGKRTVKYDPTGKIVVEESMECDSPVKDMGNVGWR